MQHVRNSILRHVRLGCPPWQQASVGCVKTLNGLTSYMCTSANTTGSEHLMARVIGLVKKFDKTEASKVTETADFQKDLSLDSLDRVELVMAFEEEFSIEIPEDKADKLCCVLT
ncbi:uncharacterized protein M6B38_185150 [Iris pallida]|uniref:Acyl carrier protein n=1 Tax=Iris pallida TaxID=29817 RepID=A0AAX6EM20_IRIPA|nr:uncharacterized protein M6B38_185150 [Iris pallida]